MTPEEKELIRRMGEAIDICLDWVAAKVIDDEEYSDLIDLQNEIKEKLGGL